MLAALLLLACGVDTSDGSADTAAPLTDTGEVMLPPCSDEGAPEVQLAAPGEPYGSLEAGMWCGFPPQGGAPYSPINVRLKNMYAARTGATAQAFVRDVETNELLGYAEQPLGFVCANVGENAGHLVAAEVHIRYPGIELSELDGREVSVEVRMLGGDLAPASTSLETTLGL